MPIISTHDITLYGGNDVYDIVLRPLSDEHLPLLYKWNTDPEVLYWTEGGKDIVRSYDHDTVHCIYGGDSKNILYFLVEVNGEPIGECWIQRMNLPDVIAMYPTTTDVRRIDMSIGEKEYWNKGIGTLFIGMLIDYAFYGENVDILHCFSEDYNIRSRRMWQKHGFSLVRTDELPQPQKGKLQYHFCLTRKEFSDKKRIHLPQDKIFYLPINQLQPSQLWISDGKLRLCREWFDATDISKFDPIPIKEFQGRHLMTDGHSRALMAYLSGFETIPCYQDEDELDMKAYSIDIAWCDEEGIKGIRDLANRVVSHKDYERLWRKRCMEMRYYWLV